MTDKTIPICEFCGHGLYPGGLKVCDCNRRALFLEKQCREFSQWVDAQIEEQEEALVQAESLKTVDIKQSVATHKRVSNCLFILRNLKNRFQEIQLP